MPGVPELLQGNGTDAPQQGGPPTAPSVAAAGAPAPPPPWDPAALSPQLKVALLRMHTLDTMQDNQGAMTVPLAPDTVRADPGAFTPCGGLVDRYHCLVAVCQLQFVVSS